MAKVKDFPRIFETVFKFSSLVCDIVESRRPFQSAFADEQAFPWMNT